MPYVVFMAGGADTRRWPLNRRGMCRQLLRLNHGKSLLRIAYERVQGLIPDDRIFICAGAAYLGRSSCCRPTREHRFGVYCPVEVPKPALQST